MADPTEIRMDFVIGAFEFGKGFITVTDKPIRNFSATLAAGFAATITATPDTLEIGTHSFVADDSIDTFWTDSGGVLRHNRGRKVVSTTASSITLDGAIPGKGDTFPTTVGQDVITTLRVTITLSPTVNMAFMDLFQYNTRRDGAVVTRDEFGTEISVQRSGGSITRGGGWFYSRDLPGHTPFPFSGFNVMVFLDFSNATVLESNVHVAIQE